MPKELKNLPHLTYLNISANDIMQLLKELKKLTEIREFIFDEDEVIWKDTLEKIENKNV